MPEICRLSEKFQLGSESSGRACPRLTRYSLDNDSALRPLSLLSAAVVTAAGS